MRAVQVVKNGPPRECVEVRDIAVPEVPPGMVRIAARAASINFGDIARCRGTVASVMGQPPFTLGMDACGVVDAVGDGVTSAAVGDRVTCMAAMSLGGMAEYVLAPAHSVFAAPATFDDGEAAAFLLPYHVSYLALHRRARLQAGEQLLVIGGASGVGSAAIQLGRAAGAHVIAAAGGAAKAQQCLELGADVAIDYDNDDLFDKVMEATNGHGADVAFDVVGGARTETVWTTMAFEGRYVPVGFNDDAQAGLTGRPLRKVSTGNFSVLGVMLSYNVAPPQVRRMGLNMFAPAVGGEVNAALVALADAGQIRPFIGQRIIMEDVGEALAAHEERRTTGRTVVEITSAAMGER